jgi:hypothetical protein
MRRAATALGIVVLVVSAAAGAAHAHGGARFQKGFVSTVSAVLPNVLGVSANVTGGDARLRVSNYSGKTVLILGYENEPYLRFDSRGVWANTRSPAVYLNRYRRSRGLHPGIADPDATPRWNRVAKGASYEWYDHRIHWNKATPPRGVRLHPDRVQRIFDWRVPARTAGRPFAITGLLGYTPPESPGAGRDLLFGVVGGGSLLVLALAAVFGVRARGRRRGPSSSEVATGTERAPGS